MKEIVIANLSMDFALRIVNLYKNLCDDKQEYVMSKQLLYKASYLTENEHESMMKDLRIIIGTLVNTIKKTKDNVMEEN